MSVMGFQKSFARGRVGGKALSSFILDFLEFF